MTELGERETSKIFVHASSSGWTSEATNSLPTRTLDSTRILL